MGGGFGGGSATDTVVTSVSASSVTSTTTSGTGGPTGSSVDTGMVGAGGMVGTSTLGGTGMMGSGGVAGTAGSGGAGSGGMGTDGGGGVTGGTGGTDGGGDYQPCPTNGDPCKIMPLGDSITFGVGDTANAGYRGPLFAKAVAAGQKITFTGSLSNGPATVSGEPFPQKNQGHSGWGISRVTPYSGGNAGIATVIPSPGFDSASGGIPHIILLHIGTNDQSTLNASEMTSDLSGFLDQLTSNAPDAYVVVAQIIPLGYGDNAITRAYNEAIPDLVQERASAGKHIALVDMYTGFEPSAMLDSDNVHPNAAGYAFMADRWYAAIEELLPK